MVAPSFSFPRVQYICEESEPPKAKSRPEILLHPFLRVSPVCPK